MAFWLAQTPAASIVESLTERELAVLELLPTHLSTQEISRELFVSVNTIRTQVRGHLPQAQVNRRSDAVAQARQLRLLPSHNLQGPTPHHTGSPTQPLAPLLLSSRRSGVVSADLSVPERNVKVLVAEVTAFFEEDSPLRGSRPS